VAFNAVENNLSMLVWRAIHSKGLPGLADQLAKEGFRQRLETLKTLATDIEHIRDIDFDKLKRLSEDRNHLAHGHFSVDQYSGEHRITGQKRATVADTAALKDLETWTNEALEIAEALRVSEVSFWFEYSDIVPERP